MASYQDTDTEKALLKKLGKARSDRQQVQDYINECYDFGLQDDRNLVGQTKTVGENRETDVYDTTFSEAIDEFSTARQDEFTPDYRPWVKISVNDGLGMSETDKIELKEELKSHQKQLYKLINSTPYYEACEPAWEDCAVSVGAIAIPYTGSGKPVDVFPVFMSDLLICADHKGRITGIWFEQMMSKEYIESIMSKDALDIIHEKLPAFKSAKPSQKFKVVQGDHKDMSSQSHRYISDLVVQNKVITMRPMEPGVPPMIIPLRWNMAQKNGWPYGPCKKALPNARILDELGYNNMVHLSYASRFPISYENDGQQNYENGIVPGGAYPRARGTNAPTVITPGTKGDDFYDREELKMGVKKALHVDKPEQVGKTPPTTTQWLDQRADHIRGKAKRRIYREHVLPVLQRFSWVFSRRGELPPIKIDNQIIQVEFLSPMAQTSDANEVSAGMQFVQAGISMFGEQGNASIDAYETLEKWKEKLADDTVVLKRPSQQDDLVQQMFGQGRNITKDG